jgi:uncharacterized protein YggL (DUF469 family)
MTKQPTSKGRIRQLNPRQRKKLRLGEFQELIFLVRAQFHTPLDESAYIDLWTDFISFIEPRKLWIGGLGGSLPLSETEGMIQACGRGSPSEEDRQAVITWLRARPEIASASADDFVDGWYSWD